MITITHPSVTEGTVEVSGLTFVDGKAEVAHFDDAARAVLTDHGFKFAGEPEKPKDAEDEKPSKSWKVDRLTEWAAEHGVELGEAKTKDDILAAIAAAEAAPAGEPENQKDADAS